MTQRKVAIVTGASSGIGDATVRTLLDAGYSVYCGARRLERMKDLEELGATVAHLDLTDEASIAAFVGSILDEESRIDVLVNNAGYGSYGAIEDISLDEARRQFEVNLFGLAAMTNAVLPTMRSQRSGRVVHIGSSGGKIWSILGGWYQATKFALEGLADCTRNELRPFGIDVVLIEPGAIKTEWMGIAVDNLLETSGSTAYKPIAKKAAEFLNMAERIAVSPQVIADVILKAVTAKRPKARYAAPGNIKILIFVRRVLSDRMFDALSRRLMKFPKTVG